ncbi:MAG TPA: bifunctional (p)ppGpp synthetase/guanosine-3',5'-bis(diphosphate) 3'-pyrophosphohydrolase [Nannocystaceae bacterium]|nr:bifunctional (p)ppGpp synthetase/guanosine-3',5'-bis(diphosphate) 3'-pyrophosphohydrolase [Nannocystaceae bacterium]
MVGLDAADRRGRDAAARRGLAFAWHRRRGEAIIAAVVVSSDGSLEQLLAAAAKLAPEAPAAIERAVGVVREHAKDPEPTLTTAAAVARVLVDLRLDDVALQAAIVCEAGVASDVIGDRLGKEVAKLVDGVARLEHVRWDHLEQEATENLRKMFLALASDMRVVLIALAERVHVMRGLDERAEPERRKLAHETMEVYAPLANRLGIWQMKWELEDLAFRALSPEVYREIKGLLAGKRTARTAAIDEVTAMLEVKLAESSIAGKVSGRPKHIYSIYKKMQRKKLDYEQIYDVSAVRVIVERLEDCYAVLGMVHGQWTPIAGEFDDYIARPKGNDYRSLHTAVVGPDGKPLEVQIRTVEMHELSEYGVAAHWRYKEGGKKGDRRFDAKINWLRQLAAWQREVTDVEDAGHDAGELAQALRTELFSDQVYVFTPTGDVIDLPLGATPLDFAYRIHTEVGHRCRGAKVNGQIVTLDHQLATGDRVEIITQKNGKPSRDWINPHLGYVRTASARQKIKQFFRLQEREAAILAGREAVERELDRLGMSSKGVEAVAATYPRYPTLDDFLAAVGFGDVVAASIVARLLEMDRASAPAEPIATSSPTTSTESLGKPTASRVSIGGVDDVMSHPARCCNPVPGDHVVGYITRGRGLAIHRVDCPNARTDLEPERWMPLEWGAKYGETYPVALQIVADDRAGLLRDIADVVATEGVNMSNTNAVKNARDQSSIITVTLEIRASPQIVRIINKVERMPGTRTVRRVSG